MIKAIIEGNIPWRIIGKRRKLTKTLEAHLEGIVKQIHLEEELGNKRNYIEVLRNNVENFRSQYWDVNKYEEKLK